MGPDVSVDNSVTKVDSKQIWVTNSTKAVSGMCSAVHQSTNYAWKTFFGDDITKTWDPRLDPLAFARTEWKVPSISCHACQISIPIITLVDPFLILVTISHTNWVSYLFRENSAILGGLIPWFPYGNRCFCVQFCYESGLKTNLGHKFDQGCLGNVISYPSVQELCL